MSNGTALTSAPWRDLTHELSGAIYAYDWNGIAWLQTHVFSLGSPYVGAGKPLVLDGTRSVVSHVGFPRVLERAGDEWVYVAQLRPTVQQMYDFYGYSLALDGDVAVVGAPEGDGVMGSTGLAYVFERQPDGAWLETDVLAASDGQTGDYFGGALAISGDTLVIGAAQDDDFGFTSGAAYVFERQPDGPWLQKAKLHASDASSLDSFGSAVAIDGDTIVVGAPDADAATPYAGAAYVFERDASGAWQQAQKLSDSTSQTSAFGVALALNGELLLVGDPGYSSVSGMSSGAMFLYVHDAQYGWTQHARLMADDGAEFDSFARVLALDGSFAVIGAPYDDDNGTDSGSAYIFRVGPDYSGNGVPDICECPGDIDYSGAVGLSDLSALLTSFGLAAGQSYESGDIDGDYDVDLSDLSALLERFGVECP